MSAFRPLGAGVLLAMAMRWPMAQGLDVVRAVAILTGVLLGAVIAKGAVTHAWRTHSLQLAPLAVGLSLLHLRPRAGILMAVSLCACWSLVSAAALGLTKRTRRPLSAPEFLAVSAIGVVSGAGCLTACAGIKAPITPTDLVALIMGGILQIGALWISYEPVVVRGRRAR